MRKYALITLALTTLLQGCGGYAHFAYDIEADFRLDEHPGKTKSE